MAGEGRQYLRFADRDNPVREALIDHSEDILRMKSCFSQAGYDVNAETLAAAWLSYSQGFAATWLGLPDDDRRLLRDLLEGQHPALILSPTGKDCWTTSLVNSNDGHSHRVELPNELLAELGWEAADVVEIARLPCGEIRLRKL